MDNAEKQQLVEQYIKAYNDLDVGGMVALMTPDVVFENVSGGRVNATTRGVNEFRQLAERGVQLFSERSQTVTAWTFSPNAARVTLSWRGVFGVNVPDGARKGTVLELQGESAFEFADGRISRIVDRS